MQDLLRATVEGYVPASSGHSDRGQGRMAARLAHASLEGMPHVQPALWAVAMVAGCAGLSALLILILRPILMRHLLAHPNARSSHQAPTPQGAGLAVMASVFAGCAVGILVWAQRESRHSSAFCWRRPASLCSAPSTTRSALGLVAAARTIARGHCRGRVAAHRIPPVSRPDARGRRGRADGDRPDVVRERGQFSRWARLDDGGAGGADHPWRRRAPGARRRATHRSACWRSPCSAPRSASPCSTSIRLRSFSAMPAACRSVSASPSC